MNPGADPLFVAAEVAYRRERYTVGTTPRQVWPERSWSRLLRRAVRRHLTHGGRRDARGRRGAGWDGLAESRHP